MKRGFWGATLVCLVAACSGGADTAPDSGTEVSTTSTPMPTTSTPTATSTTTTTSTTTSPTTTTTTAPDIGAPGVYSGEWDVVDPPASFDIDYIDSLVEESFDVRGVRSLRSVVVVHDDRIVYERYHPDLDADSIMVSYSVAKSFASAVVGILVGEGRLDLDAPAPVAEWSSAGDSRGSITLENLLHMSSGLRWTEGFDVDSGGADVLRILVAPDAAAFAASRPLEDPIDTVFEYSSGTTAIIGRIIADALGGSEEVEPFVRKRLLDPIGIESTRLQKDPTGRWIALLGADSTSRDFARFGLLFLHDGVWGDERVLPEGWVEYSRTPASTTDEYGAHWWIVDGELEARGLFGQLIRVSPRRDVVIAINRDAGSLASGGEDLVTAILDQFATIR